MTECKCNKEREIAVMQAELKSLFKKADRMDEINRVINSLDKNQAITTQLLNNVLEHDKKQDIINQQMTETLSDVSMNLREISETLNLLNRRVETLEERVDKNEALHNIDMRTLKKKHYTEVLSRYILPTGGVVVIIMQVIEFLVNR